MLENGASLCIYTVGHSNYAAADLVSLLQRNGVEVLVDVRSVPYSQYTPHFNLETLSRSLRKAGIKYLFADEHLGRHPQDPTCYKNGLLTSKEKPYYLKLLDFAAVAKRQWYRDGISRLLKIARERPIAIMCSEEDPAQCHRHHLIAQTLLEMDVTVLHIRRHGNLEKAARIKCSEQLSLFCAHRCPTHEVTCNEALHYRFHQEDGLRVLRSTRQQWRSETDRRSPAPRQSARRLRQESRP